MHADVCYLHTAFNTNLYCVLRVCLCDGEFFNAWHFFSLFFWLQHYVHLTVIFSFYFLHSSMT